LAFNPAHVQGNSKNKKIYAYDIFEEPGQIGKRVRRKGSKAVKVDGVLAHGDLFTILRLDDQLRVNFESMFGRYEANYLKVASDFLAGVYHIKESAWDKEDGISAVHLIGLIKELFKFKTMSWLRNPYRIKEIVNIFAPWSEMCIDSSDYFKLYREICTKRDSEIAYTCSLYGVTHREYKSWLRILLLFFYPVAEAGYSHLDDYVEQFFSAEDLCTNVHIYFYDSHSPVVPDCAVVTYSDKDDTSLIFNVSNNCFVLVNHRNLNGPKMNDLRLNGVDSGSLTSAISKKKCVKVFFNNMKALTYYNINCLRSSRKNLYSASKDIYGLDIAQNAP